MTPLEFEPRDRVDCAKLRSVLVDRVTRLPALPLLFDDLRAALDGRRRVGVLALEPRELELVESLYGWQVFDRIVRRGADELRLALGRELPADTLLAVNAVAGAQLLAFVLPGPRGPGIEPAALARIAAAVVERLEGAFRGEEFAGLSPAVAFRVGTAMLGLDPFFRFERRVMAAVEQALRADAERERRREMSWGEELQRIIRDATVRSVFQPVVDLRTGVGIGFEALVRGPRESLFETPRVMFGLSARLGLDVALDRVCLGAGLRAASQLDQPHGRLFVNALPVAFEAVGASPGPAWALLDAAWVSPRDVVVEFGERAVEARLDGTVAVAAQLRERGFAIALDDAGTGSRTREIVERLAPEYLKLDVSLVRDAHLHLLRQEVLATLVRDAHAVGATVVAEGVESAAELAVLIEVGAGLAQGYLYGGPAPARAARPPSAARSRARRSDGSACNN